MCFPAGARVGFGRGDFLKVAAEMHSGGSRAVRRFPGNGVVQRVIDFEDAGTVTVLREPAGESRRETVARDGQQLGWGYVPENGVVILEAGQGFNTRGSFDCAAERREVPAESIGDRLRAAPWNGPAHRMRGCAENYAKGGAQRLIKAQEGMRGETSEERLGALAAEQMRKCFCRRESSEAEARKQERMGGQQMERTEDFGGENRPALDERLHQAAPAFAVRPKNRFGVPQIALESYGGAVIERMRQGSGRVNPLQTVSLQWKGRKKRGARGAARLRLRFEDVNAHAALREGDGGCEAVRPGAHYAGSGALSG